MRPLHLALPILPVTLVACAFYLKDPQDRPVTVDNPTCTDTLLDGDETDSDCGGSCLKCKVGQACRTDNDCDVDHCAGGTCQALPCENGVKDGNETDVDCGGDSCHPCPGGLVCIRNEDCFDRMCSGGSCYQQLPTISFAPAVSYPSDYKPYFIVSADLDGDGHVDLGVVNEEGSDVTTFLGNADGTFTKLPTLAPLGEYPTGAVLGDFNADGKLDIATSNFHGLDVTVILGDGKGGFSAPVHYPAGGPGADTANIAMGDFNGDGVKDLVVTNPGIDNLTLLFGKPDGTFVPGAAPLTPGGKGSQPFSVTVGDYNGDGKDDVAAALFGGSTVNVYLGKGDGTFLPNVSYPAGGLGAYFAITTDMNLDGIRDIVLADRGGDSVSVLLGKGDGTFKAARVSPTGMGTGPYSVAVTDLNKDGVPDVVTTNYLTNSISLLVGNGDGHFRAPINPGSPGMSPYGVAVGDFNGDGKPDLGIVNASSNDLGVLLNTSH